MTTNPYASPVTTSEPGQRAEQEIRSVIRTFRMLAIFSIAEALVVVISILPSLAEFGPDFILNLMVVALHLAMIACAIFSLRVAASMARRELGTAKWARRLSLMLTLSFPLFPIGFFCVPVFAVAGALCYRKVKRYYPDYCEAAGT